MNMKFRKTLVAGAIAALTATTVWAADPPKYGSDAATKAELGQPTRSEANQLGSRDGASQQRAPQSGGSSMGQHMQSGPGAAGNQAASSGVYNRSANSLVGTDIVDRAGNDIGDIKQVVLAPDRKSAHAVVSVGGILGMGAREVRVPLDKLTPLDDKLQWSVTEEQIEAMEKHTQGQFVELKGNTPISGEITEFSAFEPVKGGVDAPGSSSTPSSTPNSPMGGPSGMQPGGPPTGGSSGGAAGAAGR